MRPIAVDLFAGLHGWTRGLGDEWLIISVELNPKLRGIHRPNQYHLEMDVKDPSLPGCLVDIFKQHGRGRPDLLFASPPCQGFSIASCSTHWTPPPSREPKTEKAREAVRLVERVLELIDILNPRYWVIENPRGLLRKMPIMEPLRERRNTIWLCQYHDTRGKPTDLWAELPPTWGPRPVCRNHRFNAKGEIVDRQCHHEAARRGAKTGTQGLSGGALRSKLPQALGQEIAAAVLGAIQ